MAYLNRYKLKVIYQILRYYLKCKGKRILLIPPTSLNGSFGDELMCLGYIQNNNDNHIDIYTDIDRKDLFGKFENVSFVPDSKLIDWSRYQEICLLGADIMTGSYGKWQTLRMIKKLAIANKLGIQTKILGFSLKENNDSEIMESLKSLSAKTDFFIRDIDSFERARNLCFSNISQVADLAFLTNIDDKPDEGYKDYVSRYKNNLKIAICPNALHASDIGKDLYIEQFASFLEKIYQPNLSFIFLFHDLREHCGELSDRDISFEIYNILQTKISACFFGRASNAIELKKYLFDVDMTIAARMHFGISGLSLGKPMFGISYEDKFTGLHRQFGLDPNKTITADYRCLLDDIEKCKDFIANISTYQTQIHKCLPNVKELSFKNFT